MALAILAIGVAVYLYLKQARIEQEKKYDTIISYLRQLSKEISALDAKVSIVDRLTGETQNYLLETQRQILFQFAGIKQMSELFPRPTNPEIARKLSQLGQEASNK